MTPHSPAPAAIYWEIYLFRERSKKMKSSATIKNRVALTPATT